VGYTDLSCPSCPSAYTCTSTMAASSSWQHHSFIIDTTRSRGGARAQQRGCDGCDSALFALFKHCFILFHEENSDFSGCARTHSHQPSFAPDQKAERGAVGGLVGHVPSAAQEQVEREFGPLGHFQRQR
jgi:hypothetical protein